VKDRGGLCVACLWMDELVAELRAVCASLGVEPLGPAEGISAALARIDQAVAPLRVPASVRRLWELIDGHSLENTVRCHPGLSRPEFVLRGRDNSDPDFVPAHFLDVFYTSHAVMSVELDGPDWEGGCLFDWFISDPDAPLVLKYRSIEDWLLTLIETLQAGAYNVYDWGGLLVDSDRQDEFAAARRRTCTPHELYGTDASITADRDVWPAAWLTRSAYLER
jgi:hypothetical protein